MMTESQVVPFPWEAGIGEWSAAAGSVHRAIDAAWCNMCPRMYAEPGNAHQELARRFWHQQPTVAELQKLLVIIGRNTLAPDTHTTVACNMQAWMNHKMQGNCTANQWMAVLAWMLHAAFEGDYLQTLGALRSRSVRHVWW